MEQKDLPSSSDESDADFVPKEDDYNSVSESESSGGSETEDNQNSEVCKRKKSCKRRSKKLKPNIQEDVKTEVEEEKQVDVDALWADFKKDVSERENKKATVNLETKSDSKQTSDHTSSAPVKLKGISNIPNKNRTGGLSKVLNQIGKKDKMSTLQKSQLDWNNFKRSEGIEEEIKLYNKGKDGYLDKQDFLQRTDLRQFEIEKDLRTSRRKF